jgi:DNA-directed RNA polymerase II subunit RPB4
VEFFLGFFLRGFIEIWADRRGFFRNLTKTLDYLEVFSRFKDEENIKAVERLLNSHTELEMFERSQLG